jgi:phosphoenolpyruvate carboxykinase (diphosphate)
MLRPEKQNLAEFAEGVNAIAAAQCAVAREYFEDGSAAAACPPIKALLHIMAYGNYEGKRECDPSIRELFTRESLLASDWYRERLKTQKSLDCKRWTEHRDAVSKFLASGLLASRIDLQSRLAVAEDHLKKIQSESYVPTLVGTIGADPYVM